MELGFLLLVFLFFIFYLSSKNFIVYNLRKSLTLPIIFLAFILCLILFPAQSYKAAQYGFNLWLNVVFPSLFPFFVGAELLNGTGLIRAAGILLEPIMRPLFNVPGAGSFAFAMGICSGYPVGAKITSDLRQANLCTKTEAERLLAFTNNSSPLFITGAVATGIFGNPKLGLWLLSAHILACITVGILFRFYKRSESKKGHKINQNLTYRMLEELNNSPKIYFSDIGLLLGNAIKNSISTLLMICGFIVLFSVIINILISIKVIFFLSLGVKYIFQYLGIAFSMAPPLVSGLFEITTGINYINQSFAPLCQKIIIAAFILGWGGLSIHAQVASIISKSGISLKPYLIGKFLQGLFAAIYTALFLNISGITKSNEIPVFNEFLINNHLNSLTYLIISSKITIIIIMAVLTLLAIRKLLKYSFCIFSVKK